MSVIEMVRLIESNIELTVIGISTFVSHCNQSFSIMLYAEVFIFKLISINAFSARSILFCDVSTLDHKVFHDSMEVAAFVSQLFPFVACSFLSCTELSKIFNCFWNDFFEQFKNYFFFLRAFSNFDGHSNFGVLWVYVFR